MCWELFLLRSVADQWGSCSRVRGWPPGSVPPDGWVTRGSRLLQTEENCAWGSVLSLHVSNTGLSTQFRLDMVALLCYTFNTELSCTVNTGLWFGLSGLHCTSYVVHWTLLKFSWFKIKKKNKHYDINYFIYTFFKKNFTMIKWKVCMSMIT